MNYELTNETKHGIEWLNHYCKICGVSEKYLYPYGGGICGQCLQMHYTNCQICDTVIRRDDAINIIDYGKVCKTCLESPDIITCDDCGCHIHASKAKNIDDRHLCSECAAHWFKCADCDTWEKSEDEYYNADGDRICEECEESYVICHHCDDIVHQDDIIYLDAYDRYVCQSCLDDQYYQCENCNEYISIDDTYYCEGDTLCEDCYCDESSSCDQCGDTYYSHHLIEESGEWLCDDCRRSNPTRPIMDYDYSPDYVKHLCDCEEECSTILFGIELEGEMKSGYDRYVSAESVIEDDLIICKSDGSLSYGYEAVTHPASYRWLCEDGTIERLCKNMRKTMVSHDTDTCGLHISLSRERFNHVATYRFIKIFINNWEWMVKFSRRTRRALSQWCEKPYLNDTYSITENLHNIDGEKYRAVALRNRRRIEVRIFRGSLNPETVKASLELCVLCSILAFGDAPIDSIDETTIKNLSREMKYESFISYCNRRKL